MKHKNSLDLRKYMPRTLLLNFYGIIIILFLDSIMFLAKRFFILPDIWKLKDELEFIRRMRNVYLWEARLAIIFDLLVLVGIIVYCFFNKKNWIFALISIFTFVLLVLAFHRFGGYALLHDAIGRTDEIPALAQ